jgi:hypothetical protein
MVNLRLTVLAAAAALLIAAPAASATTETASGGPVNVTLSYAKKSDYIFKDLHLKIERGGVVAVDQAVISPDCGDICSPAGPAFGRDSSIQVVDLDGDGEPEVIVDLYTGGAHCCFTSQIYSLISAGPGGLAPTYAMKEHNFFDPGYTLTDVNGDGIPEFKSADGRFAYAISSYAGSGMPIQILRWQGGDLADVTGEFPALVKSDSKHFWHRYRKYAARKPPYNDPGLGGLAAWAADEYRLGHGARVQRELKAALRRGWLGSVFGSGRSTVRNLNKLLSDAGYR